MPNSTTTTTALAATAPAALAKVLRQRNNVNAAKFFAAGMAGIMTIFIILNWTRFLFKHYCQGRESSGVLDVPIKISRAVRSRLLRKVPGFTSAGHCLVFLGYLATCIPVSFVHIDWSTLNGFAKRLGWVTVSNLALITFLALKNTPLAFLTAYSYERLNVLHRLAGYGTVCFTMLHAVVYITAWSKSNTLDELLETSQVVGIVAGFAMLIVFSTVLLLRKLRYEIFYIVHILMFMLILVTVGLHRPQLETKTLIIVIFAASIWIADRALRFSKLSLFSFRNSATITPLPHGGTRIVLRRSPIRAVAGSHCFLWIPKIRATETHPFTIVSTKPLELVVVAYDGFTRDLHAFALKNSGVGLRASIDGPYGTVPDFTIYTKVVFIAGGSGASFTSGAAADLVRKLSNSQKTRIEFVWVVREDAMISWFSKELAELAASPLVNLHIHATRSSTSLTQLASPSTTSLSGIEKVPIPTEEPILMPSTKNTGSFDIEIAASSSNSPSSPRYPFEIMSGRPDVVNIVTDIVDRAEKNESIAVAACGPDSLMQTTRKTVARNIRGEGPSLEFHCEQFGW